MPILRARPFAESLLPFTLLGQLSINVFLLSDFLFPYNLLGCPVRHVL